MRSQPPIPKELWDTIPPAAQAALLAVFAHLQHRIDQVEKKGAALETQLEVFQEENHKLREENLRLRVQLNQNSTNSSKPSMEQSLSTGNCAFCGLPLGCCPRAVLTNAHPSIRESPLSAAPMKRNSKNATIHPGAGRSPRRSPTGLMSGSFSIRSCDSR